MRNRMTAEALEATIDRGIEAISQNDLAGLIRELRTPIRLERRGWNYSAQTRHMPCWIFAEHLPSNTAFSYCEEGFGPGDPWGLLSIRGEDLSMGTDAQWFLSIEDQFRCSSAWKGENPPGYEVG